MTLQNKSVMDPGLADAMTTLKLDIFRTMNCVKIGRIQSFDGTKNTSGATDTNNTDRKILAAFGITTVLRTSSGNYLVSFATPSPVSTSTYLITTSCVGNAKNCKPADEVTPRTSSQFALTVFNSTTLAPEDSSNVNIVPGAL